MNRNDSLKRYRFKENSLELIKRDDTGGLLEIQLFIYLRLLLFFIVIHLIFNISLNSSF